MGLRPLDVALASDSPEGSFLRAVELLPHDLQVERVGVFVARGDPSVVGPLINRPSSLFPLAFEPLKWKSTLLVVIW